MAEEHQESSVLFSLKELMSIEEDRIKTEEEDRHRAAAEAERARQDAERRAWEAEQQRLRGEEERRRMEEARGREEHARLEAIRHAEVERARAEAEQRARMESMAAQQAHERQLTALKQDEGKKKLRNALIGGGIVAVLVIGVGAFFAVRTVQEQQAESARITEEKRRIEEEKEKLERMQREADQKLADLSQQLANAPTPEDKARLERQLAEAQENASKSGLKVPGRGVVSKGGGDTGKPPPAPKCRPGDPLCENL